MVLMIILDTTESAVIAAGAAVLAAVVGAGNIEPW